MKHLLLGLTALVIFGCSTTTATRGPGQALLIGENSSSVKVMIRTIDAGEILWVGNYTLGTTAVLMPGKRNINAMCQFNYSWGQKLVPGNIEIDVQPDTDIKLAGQLSSDQESCVLSVSI